MSNRTFQDWELNLLNKVFGEITITTVIAKEFGEILPDWISIKDPDQPLPLRIISSNLDAGEI